MVCQDSWKAALAVTCFMVGLGLASCSGYFSDRFGRRSVFLTFKAAQFLFAGALSLSWNYESYVVLCVMVGFASMANYGAGFVLVMEMLQIKRRFQIGIAMCLLYALGYVSSPLVGYLLPNWRWYLRAVSLMGILYIPLFWYIPESLSWCMVSNKEEQSKALIKNIAHDNGKEVDVDNLYKRFQSYQAEKAKEKNQEVETIKPKNETSYFRQCMEPTMRIRYIIMCFSWAAATMIYFAISLYPTKLSGDRILNMLFIGLAELPATALAYYLPRSYGRVRSTSLLFTISGVACALSPFLKKVHPIAVTVLVLISKTAVTAAFDLIYILVTEISPTLVRSTSMGAASLSARIGGVIMPFLMLAGEGGLDFIPYLIMGTCAIAVGVSYLFFIPETSRVVMPDSLEMAVNNKRIYGVNCCKDMDAEDTKAASNQSAVIKCDAYGTL